MKVRVLLLLLLVSLVSVGFVEAATLTEPGVCATDNDLRCSGDICQIGECYDSEGCSPRSYDTWVNKDRCGAELECFIFNDDSKNAYCIPEENGCINDEQCDDDLVCDIESYTCKTPVLFGEFCDDTSLCVGENYVCGTSGICEFSSLGDPQPIHSCNDGLCNKDSVTDVKPNLKSIMEYGPHTLGVITRFESLIEKPPYVMNYEGADYRTPLILESEPPGFWSVCSCSGCNGRLYNSIRTRNTYYMLLAPGQEIDLDDKTGTCSAAGGRDISDDLFSVSVYDVSTGKRVVKWGSWLNSAGVIDGCFSQGHRNINSLGYCSNGWPSVLVNDYDEPRWFKFINTYQNSGGGVAASRVRFDKDLGSFVEPYNETTLMVDSGKFVDENGALVSFPGHVVNSRHLGYGTNGKQIEGHSFHMYSGGKVIPLNFTSGGALVSCEKVRPNYYIQDSHLFLEISFNSLDSVQCNALVWEEGFDLGEAFFWNGDISDAYNSDDNPYYIPKPEELNDLLDIITIGSCSRGNPEITQAPGNRLRIVKDNEEEAMNSETCGFLSLESLGNVAETVWPGGRLIIKKVTIPSGNGPEQYEYNPVDIGFLEMETIDGVVVNCPFDDYQVSNNQFYGKSRYTINDEERTVYLYANAENSKGEPNVCTVAAWQYVEVPPYEECSNECDNSHPEREGEICQEGEFIKACLWNGESLAYKEIESNQNNAFEVIHDTLVGEGRNDIVSDYTDFYQCSELGEGALPPPTFESCWQYLDRTQPRDIHECDPTNSSDTDCCADVPVNFIELTDSCLNTCKLRNETTGDDDSGEKLCGLSGVTCKPILDGTVDDCVEEDGGCSGGTVDYPFTTPCLERDYTDQKTELCSLDEGCNSLFSERIRTNQTSPDYPESELVCCLGNLNAQSLCGEVENECADEQKINFFGLQQCDGTVYNTSNGDFCCDGNLTEVNLPIDYQPIYCTERLGDYAGFSCSLIEGENYQTLLWADSTGKILNINSEYKLTTRAPATNYEPFVGFTKEGRFIQENWGGASFLEFDFRSHIEQPSYFYLKSGDEIHRMYPVNEFTKGNHKSLTKIKLPLTTTDLDGELIDYSNIVSLGLGINDFVGANQSLFTIDNVNILYGDEMYCGFLAWTQDPDVYDSASDEEKITSQYACEDPLALVSTTTWTGSQCCGDDIYFEGFSLSETNIENNILEDPDFEQEITADESILRLVWEYGIWESIGGDLVCNEYLGCFRRNNGHCPLHPGGGGPAQLSYIDDSAYCTWRQLLSSDSIGLPINNPSALRVSFKWKGHSTSPDAVFNVTVSASGTPLPGETSGVSSAKSISLPSTSPEEFVQEVFYIDVSKLSELTNLRVFVLKAEGIFAEVYIDDFYIEPYEVIPQGVANPPAFEYYLDAKACFMGKSISEGRIVGKAIDINDYDDLYFNGEEFVHCDFYNRDEYASYEVTDSEGKTTGVPLITSSYNICNEYEGFTCTGVGWEARPVTFVLEENYPLGSESLPDDGSLPTNPRGYAIFEEGETVYCEDGELQIPQSRDDWLVNQTGLCFRTSCYCPESFPECAQIANNPDTEDQIYASCVFNDTSVRNHYCLEGDWTTRTAFAARKIIEQTDILSEDGLLSCGPSKEVLNKQNPSAVYDSACFYNNLDNNENNRKVAIAIMLDSYPKGYYESLMTFLNTDFLEGYRLPLIESEAYNLSHCQLSLPPIGEEFTTCEAGELSIYYDSDLGIVYVANFELMGNSFWDGVIAWFRNLFRNSSNTVSQDFDEIYIFNKDEKVVATANTHAESGELTKDYYVEYDMGGEQGEFTVWLASQGYTTISRSGSTDSVTWTNNHDLWTTITYASRYDVE